MNFGEGVDDPVIRQQATYYVAPNFEVPPPPGGPYALGVLVEDIKQFVPLTDVEDVVEVPKKHTSSKGGKTTASKARTAGVGIWSRILNFIIGGSASLARQQSDVDVWDIPELRTEFFFPNRAYLSQCAEIKDVDDYFKEHQYKVPVYLITGIKSAYGATLKMDRGREFDMKGKIDGADPTGTTGVEGGISAGLHSESARATEYTKPSDFVLGLRVMKVYHRKSPFGGDMRLEATLETGGATLVDDDEDATEDDNVLFEVGLGEEELQGMETVSVDSDEEEAVWLFLSKDQVKK